MSTLLHIDSSARFSGSLTRELSGAFVAQWQAKNPGGRVITRDVAAEPLPHLSEAMLGAYFTPADQRSAEQQATIATSDKLVDEVVAADTLVIGIPMYNFAAPSAFKAWIDHICRAGRTFKYTENGPVGLLSGKRAVVFLTRGGVYSEGPAKAYDFQAGYIKTVLGFIGITDVEVILAEGISQGEEKAKQALSLAHQALSAAV